MSYTLLQKISSGASLLLSDAETVLVNVFGDSVLEKLRSALVSIAQNEIENDPSLSLETLTALALKEIDILLDADAPKAGEGALLYQIVRNAAREWATKEIAIAYDAIKAQIAAVQMVGRSIAQRPLTVPRPAGSGSLVL